MRKLINVKKEDLLCCLGCGDAAGNEVLKNLKSEGIGSPYDICQHFNTEDGWWLRIDWKYDFYSRAHNGDSVGAFFCPVCHEKENEKINDLLSML